MATRPECEYIGGHRDGYDPECAWCNGYRPADRYGVDPAIVANVDQGAALTEHVLTGWVDEYRAMIADGVSSTQALLSITHSVDEAARAGAKGMDGLVSLVAVAVQKLAGTDPRSLRVGTMLACGCGYNAAGVQCTVGLGCNGHVEPCHECLAGVCTAHPGGVRFAPGTYDVEAVVGEGTPARPYSDAVAGYEAQGYVFPHWIKAMLDTLEPGAPMPTPRELGAMNRHAVEKTTNRPVPCTCDTLPDQRCDVHGHPTHFTVTSPGYDDDILAEIGPVSMVIYRTPVDPPALPIETTITTNTARCSFCYGVGTHSVGCRNNPNPPRIEL